jgi:hypothetical protein
MQTKVPSGFWVDTPCGTLAGAVCEKLGQGQTTPKAPSTTPNSVPCPTGWVEVNRFCYQVSGAGAACNSGASELSPIFCGVHVAQLYSSLWHFVNHCLSFCVLYLLDTALSVSLSFTASDIFKLFFITLLQT